MKTNQIIMGIAILAAGFGIGYATRGSSAPQVMGGHTMANGQMMSGHMMEGSSMQDMMDSMMAGLKGKTGDAFDKAFLSQMVMHHQGAVVMAEAVLKNSKRPELIQLAQDIITAQTKEIQMMEDWQAAWFK
jgi:uncharacterized protein (DUF305 family)